MANARKPVKASGHGKKAAKDKPTPLCIAMLICDRVIVGQDNVTSAIQIVDDMTLPAHPQIETDLNYQFPHLNLLVMLKTGNVPGYVHCRLDCRVPSGEAFPVAKADINLEGEPDSGGNMVSPVVVRWSGPGLYWLEMIADETLIAKTPLRIRLDEAEQTAVAEADR